jgi:hypothetical protein
MSSATAFGSLGMSSNFLTSMGNSSLAAIVFAALENEASLDRRAKELFCPSKDFVNYKVMQQLALSGRLGPLLRPALCILALTAPLLILWRFLGILITHLIVDKNQDINLNTWIMPTIAPNESLIRNAISQENRGHLNIAMCKDSREWVSRLSFGDIIKTGLNLLDVLKACLQSSGNRLALLLHARDAANLLLLAIYAKQHPDDVFATEDHYQRWAFVLSHTTQQLWIVQHGVLDTNIQFTHRYGRVAQLFVRDAASLGDFASYYETITRHELHAPAQNLRSNPHSKTGVFIASSFPTLDAEIDFARHFSKLELAPLIVKLHPAHRYDARKTKLLSLAAYVCSEDEAPDCQVFVSHSSSMELIYKSHRIPCVSLKSEGSLEAAIAAVAGYLNYQQSTAHPLR